MQQRLANLALALAYAAGVIVVILDLFFWRP